MLNVRIVFMGRHYDAAQSLPGQISLPDGATVADALNALRNHAGDAALVESCLVAVSGTHVGTLKHYVARTLVDGDEILILAPVAGG